MIELLLLLAALAPLLFLMSLIVYIADDLVTERKEKLQKESQQ